MTRSKALLFLLIASSMFMIVSSVLLWTGRASGWAFFVVGTVGVITYIASLSADVVNTVRGSRDEARQVTEFDL